MLFILSTVVGRVKYLHNFGFENILQPCYNHITTKENKTMTWAVLPKSSIRKTKRGTMFTMTLCDRDTTSTIRVVCFEDVMFNKFTATKIYDLKYFKLKKGFGNYNNLE